MQYLAKINKYLLIVVLYAVLITPLLVVSKYIFPFITPKTIYFRMAVEVAGFLYLVLALTDAKYRPKMNLLQWLVLAFGVIILITGITGANFYKSFWGTIERGEGFLTVSHVIAYFLILTWTFKTKREWLNFMTGMVVVSVGLCSYALKQKFTPVGSRVKFFWWDLINPGEGRLSATIGNAAFMAAYMLANFYITLMLIVGRKSWWWRVPLMLIGCWQLYVLYYTQTRGAWIGLIGSLFLLALVIIFRSKNNKVKIVTGAIMGLFVLFVVLVLMNKNSEWVKNSVTIDRLVNISRKSITVESRLLAWDSSWKGWKDRFVLGYGWENYNIAFNKYFHAEIFKDQGSQLWFDRAHNTIFDVGVTTGIFGLLVYLSIFGTALYYLWQIIKTGNENSNLALVLGSALIAHFVQNIFVFDVLSTYIMLFGMLALVAVLRDRYVAKEETEFGIKWPNIIIVVIGLVVVIFSIFVFNVKPIKANQRGVDALMAFRLDKITMGVSTFKEAIEMGTYQSPELRQKLAENILLYNRRSTKLTDQQKTNNYNAAIEEIGKNIEQGPDDVQNYLYLMTLLNATQLKSNLEKVEVYGQKALSLSPTRPQTYFEMGQAKILLGQKDEGLNYFKKAVDLAPWAVETHWNLAAACIMAGKQAEADAEFAKIEGVKGFSYNSQDNLNRMVTVYIGVNNMDKLRETLLKLLEYEPANGDYWAKLAAVYKALGDKEKAKEAVKKAVEINPDRYAAEAEVFLKMLEE